MTATILAWRATTPPRHLAQHPSWSMVRSGRSLSGRCRKPSPLDASFLSLALSLPPPPSQREKKLRESFQIEFLFFIHLARKTKIFFPSLYMCGFHFWNNISLYFGGIGYFLKSCHSPQNLESRGSRVERIFRTNLHIRVARPFLFP